MTTRSQSHHWSNRAAETADTCVKDLETTFVHSRLIGVVMPDSESQTVKIGSDEAAISTAGMSVLRRTGSVVTGCTYAGP